MKKYLFVFIAFVLFGIGLQARPALASTQTMYVVDYLNYRVEEFTATGTFIKNVTSSLFNTPQFAAIDASGNMWVSDAGLNEVLEFSSSTGAKIGSFGSTGTSTGQFEAPQGIAINGSGDFWVADGDDRRIEEFNPSGTYMAQATNTLGAPEGLTIDASGNVWVADLNNNDIAEFSATGTYIKKVGSYGSTGACNGYDYEPTDAAIDASGNVWIVEYGNNCIGEFSAAGAFVKYIGSSGTGTGQFNGPQGIAIDAGGNMWVTENGNNRVQEFSSTGTYENYFGSAGSGNGEFNEPYGIIFNPGGFVAPPSIASVSSTAGTTGATITWTTNVGADSSVSYGTSTTYTASSTYSSTYVTSHSVSLSGLTPSTTYDYQVVSSNGSVATSSNQTFTTTVGNTNISSSSSQHWVWNDNIGWIDFYDTQNIIVSSTNLTGYASSSVGSISLDCGTAPNGSGGEQNICAKSNYGVSNDGNGNLAGWAWNDTYGWISFCGNNSGGGSTWTGSSWVCPSGPTYQVLISPSTGVFSGWAWNDNIGWISFNCSNTGTCTGGATSSQYDVVTAWTAVGTTTTGMLDSETFDTGVSTGAQINSIIWQGSAPASTTVGFQFAVSSSSSGPWTFAGPDGTSGTTYTGIAGLPITLTNYSSLAGRYFRYRVILRTNPTGTATPQVQGISVSWSP
jgi:sugar lactone lactonase YvrE